MRKPKNKRTGWYLLIVLLILFMLRSTIPGSTNFILICLLIAGLLVVINIPTKEQKTKKKGKKNKLPDLNVEKEKHYHDLGMSDQEIAFFRETMATAREQIIQLEKNMNSTAKLKAINLRNDTVRAAKAMFKEMVRDPQKLHQADRFLYTHLPNLLDLTAKYNEINQHEIKSKETYTKLAQSAEVIEEVSQLIVADYQKFVADDLEDMDVEISIAKQSLTRDNSSVDDNFSEETTIFSEKEEEK